MPSTLIYWAYTDVYPDKIADLNEQKRRRQVWDSYQDILGDIIYTVMKRQEHKRNKLKESMQIAFSAYPALSVSVTQSTFTIR